MANKNKGNQPVGKKAAKQAARQNNVLPAFICAIVIAIVTYFVFSPSMENDFTNWDDPTYVMDNPLVVNNAVPVKEIFQTPVSLNYHPITMLTLAWNYQSGKLDPKGYHQENVLLHILNTLLVFLFIYLLTRRNWLMAAIVALFFGVHPMHVESVSWISERKDVLYVFFLMGGLVTYLYYIESKKIPWYILSLVLFILSCLSKGMAVVFPVLLLLIDYLKGVKPDAKILLNKIPFFGIALGFGIAAFKIQAGGAIADIQTFTILQRVMFASYGAIMYIVKFFVPTDLSAFYPYPTLDQKGDIPLIFYLSPVILLAIAALVFLLRKHRAVVFGLLFYIVSVALVLQFVSVGSAILADRYSYLAYIGLLFPIAWFINKAWEAKEGMLSSLKYPLVILAGITAVAFSYQTYARTQIWKNSETLWTDVIAKHPDVQTAWKNRGNYYGQNNQVDKAMLDYRMLVKMNTKDSKVYSNMGNVYGLRQQGDSALWAYSKAIELDANNADAYVNRAITFCMAKQYERAFPDFEKALSLEPTMFSVYNNRGYAYLALGRYQESVSDYTNYLNYKPQDASAYYFRGQAYKGVGNVKAAEADINQARAMGYKE